MIIHNAFDSEEIRGLAERGGVIRSISGNEYDIGRVMRLLAFAVRFRPDVDVSYLEGKIAIETLREMGACSPETAVYAWDIGFRTVPASMSRSKKLPERVMHTEDGRVYLETKGPAGPTDDP